MVSKRSPALAVVATATLWYTENGKGFAKGFQLTRPSFSTPSHVVNKNRASVGFPRRSTGYNVVKDDAEARSPFKSEEVIKEKNIDEISDDSPVPASTLNDRLRAELEEATNREKFGARSSAGKKLGLVDGFGRQRKSDAEIKAAIEKARDLNGVNPLVALGGSFFALGCAALLWYATQSLAAFFAAHPVDTDVYFVVRSAQVVRNVAMGLVSLASGFFGVTGLGIFLLGVRVSYGVMTGELDPTPIKQNKAERVEMPNVWDLMTNKKPGRRRR